MKRIGVLLGLLLLLLIPAAAGQTVIVNTIPDHISVNSSFLWVATVPDTFGESPRVSWLVLGLVDFGGLGSFEKLSGNKWFCHFERTCGPNPFPVAGGPYDINVYVTSNESAVIESLSVVVSSLKVDPHIYVNGNTVLVQVNVPGYAGSAVASYSVYDAKTLEVVNAGGTPLINKNLAYCNCPAGFYNTSLGLPNGAYYLALDVTTTDAQQGGGLEYFTVGEELSPLSVSLDKNSYWLGEKVHVTGTTTYASATGEAKLADVSKRNITFSLYSRGEYSEFSYDWTPAETGYYTLTVTAGTGNDTESRDTSFLVSNLLDVEALPDFYINASDTLVTGNFTVSNLANQTINLSIYPDADLNPYVTVSQAKASLGIGESTTFSLTISGLLSSVQGNLVFSSLSDMERNVKILVEQILSEMPQLSIDPLVWSDDDGFLVGQESKTLTISNGGTGYLEDFGYTVNGIDSSIVTVTLPDRVGMAPDSADMVISISPGSSGTEEGSVRVTSNGGSQDVVIDLKFYDDMTSEVAGVKWEITAMIGNLTQRGAEIPPVLTALADEITSIESSLNNGWYASAESGLASVKDKLAVAKSMLAMPPAGLEIDLTLVLIIVVVVVVIVLVYWFLKKRGGKPEEGGEEKGEEYEGGEEDLDEEFY